MFDSVSSMTAEQFVAANKLDRAAVQAWTKGAFGDPIALAFGRATVP